MTSELENQRPVVEEHVNHFINRDLPSFSAFEIKDKYPKAYEKLRQFAGEQASMGTENIDDELLIGVLLYSPRSLLYLFFDNHNVFVNIQRGNVTETFEYRIDTDVSIGEISETKSKKRTPAEVAAFIKAFEILENKP